MGHMSIRLPDALISQVEILAEATNRSKSFIAQEAIMEFVEREAWQVAQIQEGLAQADAGDFATEEAVQAVFAKWNCNAD